MKFNDFEIEKNKNTGIFFEMDEIIYKKNFIDENEPSENNNINTNTNPFSNEREEFGVKENLET